MVQEHSEARPGRDSISAAPDTPLSPECRRQLVTQAGKVVQVHDFRRHGILVGKPGERIVQRQYGVKLISFSRVDPVNPLPLSAMLGARFAPCVFREDPPHGFGGGA
jgi:hypothetical protein